MTATTPVFPIVPTTQQYDWGKRGLESKVAQLAQKAETPGLSSMKANLMLRCAKSFMLRLRTH